MDPFIEFKEVRKSFGKRRVLQGIDLVVRRGEILVILGESGSGKSVMLRHVLGLIKPDGGRIVVDGTDITELDEKSLMPVRKKVGMLFQQGALFDSMTVAENIGFPLRAHTDLEDEAIMEKVKEKLAMVELSGIEHSYPSSLSGGMKKRVALARSIAIEPEGILYDEPTTGLDPVTGHHISKLIRNTAQRLKVTTVVVTHDIDSAFVMADRLAFLGEGRIRFTGTKEEACRTEVQALREFLSAYGGRYGVRTV